MTLDEARANIGSSVVYAPEGRDPETGVITAVSSVYVFVHYGNDRGSKATYPEDLTFAEAPGGLG